MIHRIVRAGLLSGFLGLTWLTPSLPAWAQEHEAHANEAAHGEQAGAGEHEGGHHGGFDAKTFAFQIGNLAILAFIMIKFGGAAVSKSLKARHEQLKADLDAALKAKTEAEANLAEHEHRLAHLETEVNAIRASARKDAEDEKERLLAAAQERARRIGEETTFLLDQQVKEAQAILRAEVSQAAIDAATQLLKRQVGQGDHDKLLNTFVTDVETPPTRRPA